MKNDNDKANVLWNNYFNSKSKENTDKLVEYYYQFVKNISNNVAKSINWKQMPDALSSYGAEGLHKAIEKFDPNRGVKFDTYAYQKIKGAILDGLRFEDWVPRSVRQRQDKIEKAKKKLESQLGRSPHESEIFEELKIDPSDFSKRPSKYYAMGQASIDESRNGYYEENKKDFNEKLKCTNEVSPDYGLIRKEFFSKILSCCTQEEKTIIYLYYYQKLTIKQISKNIKKTESQISQLHKKIIKKIRNDLDTANKKDFRENIGFHIP